MPGTLILCATPIGNLGDASPRLAGALREADVVYAEDTRHSRTLFQALGVKRPLRSFFAGNEEARASEVADRLAAGETVALVTDAGIPTVSDPGYSAVRAAIGAGAAVTVIPGPSAVTAAVAVSGIPAERFVFEGFLPRKGRARTDRLAALATEPRAIVLFAATSRVSADLADLSGALGEDRPVAVVRELTKVHEEVWRGTLGEAARHFAAPRGEFTLVVAGGEPAEPDLGVAVALVTDLVAGGMAMSEAVRRVAEATGTRRRRLYEAALPSSGTPQGARPTN